MHQDASSGQEFQALRNWIIKDPDVVNQYLDTPLNQILNQLESEGFSGDQIWSDIVQHPGIDLSRYRALIAPTPTEEFLALTPHQLQERNEELADALLEMIRQQLEAIESNDDVLETAGGTSTKVEHWKQHPGSTWKPNQNRSTAEKWEARGTDAAEVAVAVGVGAATYYAGKSIYSAGDRRGWWGEGKDIKNQISKDYSQGKEDSIHEELRAIDPVRLDGLKPNEGLNAQFRGLRQKQEDIRTLFSQEGPTENVRQELNSLMEQENKFYMNKKDLSDFLRKMLDDPRESYMTMPKFAVDEMANGRLPISFEHPTFSVDFLPAKDLDRYKDSLFQSNARENLIHIEHGKKIADTDPDQYIQAFHKWKSGATIFKEGQSWSGFISQDFRRLKTDGAKEGSRQNFAKFSSESDYLSEDVKELFNEENSLGAGRDAGRLLAAYKDVDELDRNERLEFESSDFFHTYRFLHNCSVDKRGDSYSSAQAMISRFLARYRIRDAQNASLSEDGRFYKGIEPGNILEKYSWRDYDSEYNRALFKELDVALSAPNEGVITDIRKSKELQTMSSLNCDRLSEFLDKRDMGLLNEASLATLKDLVVGERSVDVIKSSMTPERLETLQQDFNKFNKSDIDSIRRSLLEALAPKRPSYEREEHMMSLVAKSLSDENLTQDELSQLTEVREYFKNTPSTFRDIIRPYLEANDAIAKGLQQIDAAAGQEEVYVKEAVVSDASQEIDQVSKSVDKAVENADREIKSSVRAMEEF